MSHSGDVSSADPYPDSGSDAAAGKWYTGAYIFNNPARSAIEGDPSLCVETLYRRFRKSLEIALGEEFVKNMVVLRSMTTVFTKVLVQQPHTAVRLLHTQDATFGLRLLGFSHASEQKRRALPTNRPQQLEDFAPYRDPDRRVIVEEFIQMAFRTGLSVQYHTRKEGDILIALGSPALSECTAYDSVVELVFAKETYRAFRQLGTRGPEPTKEMLLD